MADIEHWDEDECPGCGAKGCTCTAKDIRRQLIKDRAELSKRTAHLTAKSLDYVRAGQLWALEEIRKMDATVWYVGKRLERIMRGPDPVEDAPIEDDAPR